MTWSEWTDDPNESGDEQAASGAGWPGSGWQGFAGAARQDWIGEWLGEVQRKAGRQGPGAPPPWVSGLVGLLNGPQHERPQPRAKRGDVRSAILDVLADADKGGLNGYQVIRQITERSGGVWQPSPGSVYPTIQQLLDEGLVDAEDDHGRRTLRLSEQGRDYLRGREAEQAEMWAGFAPPTSPGGQSGLSADIARLRPELGKFVTALWQVAANGTDAQRSAAIDVLADARRKLYGILAEDETDTPDSPAGELE